MQPAAASRAVASMRRSRPSMRHASRRRGRAGASRMRGSLPPLNKCRSRAPIPSAPSQLNGARRIGARRAAARARLPCSAPRSAARWRSRSRPFAANRAAARRTTPHAATASCRPTSSRHRLEPVRPIGRLSSAPSQVTINRSFVKPANQLSRRSSDVPVLPATVRSAGSSRRTVLPGAALHDLHQRLVHLRRRPPHRRPARSRSGSATAPCRSRRSRRARRAAARGTRRSRACCRPVRPRWA